MRIVTGGVGLLTQWMCRVRPRIEYGSSVINFEIPRQPPPRVTTMLGESFGTCFEASRLSWHPALSPARKQPYKVDITVRFQHYRRQAMQQQRAMELEEERRNFKLDKSQLYQKGHPDTVQGVVKEIINIGYILTLPNGREGLLAAMHLGCSGGVELLSRLYSVGEEIPVRVIRVPNPAGKDRCYVRP